VLGFLALILDLLLLAMEQEWNELKRDEE